MRAPIQVLIIPYRQSTSGGHQFAVFLSRKNPMWQFLSGGAEDSETPLEAAQREIMEEAGIPNDCRLIQLDARASIPRDVYDESTHWPAEIFVVTEYSFAVNIDGLTIQLSDEHDQFRWLSYEEATDILKWDSNRVALWELNERLKKEFL